MRKTIIILAIIGLPTMITYGQCTALFSFAAYFEVVTFNNQSNVSNAHYFWNFGDGTGSYLKNPTHKFPETGNYLVTLFAKDTVSNCSTYYEYWVDVAKYSTEICQPGITDSIYTDEWGVDHLAIIDQSTNCNLNYARYSGGPAGSFSLGMPIYLGGYWQNIAFRMVCVGQYNDGWNPYPIREAYKSSFHKYTSSKNYDDCSANFEFSVVSQDSSRQKILFRAMNKTAIYYKWYITGFGYPITSQNDTISQWYPIYPWTLWHVGLIIEGASGCQDSIFQNIIASDSVKTYASINEIEENGSFDIYPNPSSGSFIINFRGISNGITTISIYNNLGMEIKNIIIPRNSSVNNFIINLSDEANGLYILCLKNQKNIYYAKFIKQ